MSLTVSGQAPKTSETDVLTLLLTQSEWREQAAAQLGDAADALTAQAAAEGFGGKAGQQFSTATLGSLPARRVIFQGLGDEALDNYSIKEAGAIAARGAQGARAASLAVWAPLGAGPLGDNAADAVALLSEGAVLGAYRFDRYLTNTEDHVALASITLLAGQHADGVGGAATHGESVAAGVSLARDLCNEPPQVCNPAFMASTARGLAENYDFEATILGPDEVRAKGMNLLAAVGRGSDVGPHFIHLKYTGDGEITRRLAYVGKGVTFDTGGYSLKISGSMLNMHIDMGGAAAVLGAAEAIGRIRPAGVEVHFIVPTASNMVSKEAYTVNEIIKGYGGKTVEINNTDAEGRLLLADSLAYASELGVDTIVDLATLTGACVVALGEHYSALFSNHDERSDAVRAAGTRGGERLWPMPLDKRLRDKLNSPVADMKNTGDRWGGAITAALFLHEWVGETPWVHLDIAGPSIVESEHPLSRKGGSGVGVSTLVAYAAG